MGECFSCFSSSDRVEPLSPDAKVCIVICMIQTQIVFYVYHIKPASIDYSKVMCYTMVKCKMLHFVVC